MCSSPVTAATGLEITIAAIFLSLGVFFFDLIGVTVVVLAVNFMGAVFVGGTENLLQYGAGIALPIAALGLFVGLRAWSVKLNKEAAASEENQVPESTPTEE